MSELARKSYNISEFKALGEPGTFEAVVAVFGNIDRDGDRLMRGCFARTLRERGLPPIVWSHEWATPPIGATLDAKETAEGLYIRGRLLVRDGEDHATARAVYAAMKATDGDGRAPLREFSFGYRVVAADHVLEGSVTVRQITDLDLFEVGPTLVGSNPSTRLVGVKATRGDAAVVLPPPARPWFLSR